MWKIKGEYHLAKRIHKITSKPAFPRELIRILGSADIPKVGVGIIRDILVIRDDLRFEMKNLVDAGMMAKLLLAEKYPKLAYGNLSLKTSVEERTGVFHQQGTERERLVPDEAVRGTERM
jgi:hypothetical protein